jgi:CheY-like chemotaxis protein
VPTVDEAQTAGQLVLLAEDNEINREVMQEQLRRLGYASETAKDGVAALAMWSTGRYAVLLTDCHMPKMDGFDLTTAIRQTEPAGTRFPIVAITASAMQGEAARCLAHGMDHYLSKPLRMVELGPLMSRLLPRADAQSAPPAASVGDGLAPNAIWDPLALQEAVGDSLPLQRRLLEMFLRNSEVQVNAIRTAAESGVCLKVADEAHSLKSSARTVGALKLGDLCEKIESAGSAGDVGSCQELVRGFMADYTAARDAIENSDILASGRPV